MGLTRTCSCRFFITLVPCPHLNGRNTIFGRIVTGEDALQRIAQVPVDQDDRPLQPVLVSRCGELERKKKQPATACESVETSDALERGRRRPEVHIRTHHADYEPAFEQTQALLVSVSGCYTVIFRNYA